MKKEMSISMTAKEYMAVHATIYNMKCEGMVVDGKKVDPEAEIILYMVSSGDLKKEKISDKQDKIQEHQVKTESQCMFG